MKYFGRSGLLAATVCAFIILLICSSAAAGIVHVKWDSPGPTFDGASWETAYHKVQEGLDAAVSGDEVWVAAGTYVENITLKDGVGLYGGFAGTETARDQRNWTVNVTTLDGNEAGSVVTAPEGATSAAVIDGFTIRNGRGPTYGGGICCSQSSPTITNNTITENSAAHGGGIYCEGASPTIANNTITANSVSLDGGGIYCEDSSPTIGNNTITANWASCCGGISCSWSSPTIANNTILGNCRGGIYCYHSSPTITNNTILGNAEYGIGCCRNSSPTIANNTIVGHESAGVRWSSGSPTIANNIVAFNGRGVHVYEGPATVCNNCVYGNTVCNYFGLTDPTGTDGNISVDPKLASVGYGNAHLQPDSPCIHAGDDSVVQPGWVDMDGQPRIQGAHVDIGADESDGTLWAEGPYVIVRVSPDGDDANDGSSWPLAKQTVQEGIDAASMQGGEVWVKAGVYYERITLRPYAYVYGGFEGTETAREQRDWATNVTVLDGEQAGSVVVVQGGRMCSAIDGFTIRNGSTSGYGGGIYCCSSSPTITNNTITGNKGRGIYCWWSSPTITNNTIKGNHRSGISCYFSYPTITNNTIVGNSTPYFGGGIYCSYRSSPTITNNTIMGNSAAQFGGGIFCSYDSSPTITNNTIMGNSTAWSGGGIGCRDSSPTITDNTIMGNSASAEGGGIYCGEGHLHFFATVTRNLITENSAESGGGIYCLFDSPSLIVNNVIDTNTASWEGGGICCHGHSLARIANNTITGNSAAPYRGGGIWGNRLARVKNNVVAFNSSGLRRGHFHRNNCVYGNVEYDILQRPGIGDIVEDPLFVDLAGGDYHLLPDSPCIDAGRNDDAPSEDADGNPRPVDGNCDGIAVTDIGAYEYQPIPVQMDVLPGDDANVIRLRGNRLIPVAILSDAVFDARNIIPVSVLFGPGCAQEVHGRGHWEDVNQDGLVDLLLHFSCGASGIDPGDESVSLCGWTVGGERVAGSDSIRVIAR